MQHAITNAEISNLINADFYTVSQTSRTKTNLFSRFFSWCETQEESRFLWLVLTYLGQIGLALPATLAAIVFLGGNNFNLWIFACVINVPVLAVNLAAQATKVTLPALFFAWITDAVIIMSCAAYFFMHS